MYKYRLDVYQACKRQWEDMPYSIVPLFIGSALTLLSPKALLDAYNVQMLFCNNMKCSMVLEMLKGHTMQMLANIYEYS